MWPDSLDRKLTGNARRVAVYLFATALTVHVCYLCQYARTPFFWAPELDSLFDDLAAKAIVAGHLDHAPFFRAPGYLYFLAGVYRIFGHSYWAARLTQAIIGSASVVLLYRLGTRLLRPSTALVAAVAMALYGPLVYNDGELHTPVLEVFLDLALLNVALVDAPRRPKLYALAGLILGLSAITRPTILITIPILIWWLLSDSHANRKSPLVGKAGVAQRGDVDDTPSSEQPSNPGGRPAPTRTAIATVTLFLLAAALFPSLVTIRNARVSGDPVFIAAQGGINLYLGNRPGADGFTPSTPTRFRFDDEYEDSVELYGQKAAEQAKGRPLTASEAQSYWVKQSIDWWRTHPVDALRLTGKKIILAWTYREIRNNTAYDFVRKELAPFLWICFVGFWIIGPLSIAGVTLGRRDRAIRRLAAFAAVYMAGIVPFFMADRYRLPIVPILLLLGAYAVARVCEITKTNTSTKAGRGSRHVDDVSVSGGDSACPPSRPYDSNARSHRRLIATVAIALLSGIALCDIDWVHTSTPKTWAVDYWSMGNRYVRLGEYDKGEAAYQKALRLDPNNGDIWNGLGEALYDQGRLADAARCFRREIATGPDSGRAAYNEAICHEQAGDNVNAEKLLRFAIDVDPTYDRARHELDDLMHRPR